MGGCVPETAVGFFFFLGGGSLVLMIPSGGITNSCFRDPFCPKITTFGAEDSSYSLVQISAVFPRCTVFIDSPRLYARCTTFRQDSRQDIVDIS